MYLKKFTTLLFICQLHCIEQQIQYSQNAKFFVRDGCAPSKGEINLADIEAKLQYRYNFITMEDNNGNISCVTRLQKDTTGVSLYFDFDILKHRITADIFNDLCAVLLDEDHDFSKYTFTEEQKKEMRKNALISYFLKCSKFAEKITKHGFTKEEIIDALKQISVTNYLRKKTTVLSGISYMIRNDWHDQEVIDELIQNIIKLNPIDTKIYRNMFVVVFLGIKDDISKLTLLFIYCFIYREGSELVMKEVGLTDDKISQIKSNAINLILQYLGSLKDDACPQLDKFIKSTDSDLFETMVIHEKAAIEVMKHLESHAQENEDSSSNPQENEGLSGEVILLIVFLIFFIAFGLGYYFLNSME